MRIENKDERYTIFWRIFNYDDLLCWVGKEEGTIEPFDPNSDPRVDNFNDPRGKFKIEIVHNRLGGASILPVGPVYTNDTKFTFTDNNILIENYSS